MYHLAWDGQWCTKQELRQWYGEAADKIWNEAPVSKASAAEHGASALLRTMRLAQVLVRPIRYGTQLMALVPVLQSMALQSIQLSGVSA